MCTWLGAVEKIMTKQSKPTLTDLDPTKTAGNESKYPACTVSCVVCCYLFFLRIENVTEEKSKVGAVFVVALSTMFSLNSDCRLTDKEERGKYYNSPPA